MQEAEQLVIDAINVGLAAMHKVPEEELKESVLDFINANDGRKYLYDILAIKKETSSPLE